MRIQTHNLFGSRFDCECGRTHHVAPRRVVYADDAPQRVPEFCAEASPGRRSAVLMDVRTRTAAGEDVLAAMSRAGWLVQPVIVPDLPDGLSPVCDDAARAALDNAASEADLIVTVGGGVVTDLGKWLSFDRGRPFVAFATAASMNGYTSANVAVMIGGLKTLISARAPEAVLSSPSVLGAAPRELLSAGLGDVLAKSVSSADWRMNHLLFGDYYCPRSVGLIADIEPLYLERPEAIRSGEASAVEAVYEALLLTGAAMTLAGSSSPASGGEHMISHVLDMVENLSPSGGHSHDLHGRQVGMGTVLTAELYERLLAMEKPRWTPPSGGIDRAFWGPLAEPIAEQYAAKLPRLAQAAEKLSRGDEWDRLRSELRPMLRPPGVIHDCLRRSGAACSAGDIGCSRERLTAALLHGHEMRSRVTVLDLVRLAGLMPAFAAEIVERWA